MSATPFADWTPALRDDLRASAANTAVGTRLLLEDEHASHWEIRLDSANPALPLDEVGRAA